MNTPTLTPPKPKGRHPRTKKPEALEPPDSTPDPDADRLEAIYSVPDRVIDPQIYDPPAEAKACTDADIREQEAFCQMILDAPPYEWNPDDPGLYSHTISPAPQKTAPRRPTAGTDVNILVDGQHVPGRIVSTGISGFIVRMQGTSLGFDNHGKNGEWKIDHPFFQ